MVAAGNANSPCMRIWGFEHGAFARGEMEKVGNCRPGGTRALCGGESEFLIGIIVKHFKHYVDVVTGCATGPSSVSDPYTSFPSNSYFEFNETAA